MRKAAAAVGSAAFFVVAPGVVAGLVPWWLTGWRVAQPLPDWGPLRAVGAVLIAGGRWCWCTPSGGSSWRASAPPRRSRPRSGWSWAGSSGTSGTPCTWRSWRPTIVGQALALGQLSLLVYAAAVAGATATFVHWCEEPTPPSLAGERLTAVRPLVRGADPARAAPRRSRGWRGVWLPPPWRAFCGSTRIGADDRGYDGPTATRPCPLGALELRRAGGFPGPDRCIP
jgi:hypothetical protein